MPKYIIKDWTYKECVTTKRFKTPEAAFDYLSVFCWECVKKEYPNVDPLSDEFGDLVDIEQGEYLVDEVVRED